MKVCKFGGSSLANAAQITKVIDIVLADPARRIVVVSAPGKRYSGDTKVTDLLIELADTAIKGENTDRQYGAVIERYAEIASELNLGEEIVRQIEADISGRLAQVSTLENAEFMDMMKAAGEDNNAKIVAVAVVPDKRLISTVKKARTMQINVVGHRGQLKAPFKMARRDLL